MVYTERNTQHAACLGLGYQRAVKTDFWWRVFPRISIAQRITRIKSLKIWRVCRGLQAHTKGYLWQYVNTWYLIKVAFSAGSLMTRCFNKSSSDCIFDNTFHLERDLFKMPFTQVGVLVSLFYSQYVSISHEKYIWYNV